MRFHQSWEHRLDIERTLKRVDTKNPKNITDLKCSDVQKDAKKAKLTNMFGRKTKVLSITNVKELSRSKDSLECIGDAKFDTGNGSKLEMKVYTEDGKRWSSYQVKP